MGREIRRARQAQAGAAAGWRQRTLAAAGFDEALAARLAEQPQLDVHAVLELVDAGCPPRLAARIVQPLDMDWGLQ